MIWFRSSYQGIALFFYRIITVSPLHLINTLWRDIPGHTNKHMLFIKISLPLTSLIYHPLMILSWANLYYARNKIIFQLHYSLHNYQLALCSRAFFSPPCMDSYFFLVFNLLPPFFIDAQNAPYWTKFQYMLSDIRCEFCCSEELFEFRTF